MKFPSAFNPYGVIKQGTPFELRPFNFVYSDGVEVFSVIVPQDYEPAVAAIMSGTPHPIDCLDVPRAASQTPTGHLRWFLLRGLRRECDWERCSVGMRVHDDGKIEARFRFSPPWWYKYTASDIQSGLSNQRDGLDGDRIQADPIREGGAG